MLRFYSNRRSKASLACVTAVMAALTSCSLAAPGGPLASAGSVEATDTRLAPPAFTLSTATPAAAAATATAAPARPTVPVPDPDRTEWPGPISRFQVRVELDEAQVAGPVIGFYLTRSQVSFRVHYLPGEPLYIREWALALSREVEPPLLVIPGGFFTEDYLAQGLLVSDGYLYSGAHNIGGIFVVQGGEPGIRWLRSQPIRPGEEFEQAVQAFPVYVSRGRIPPLNEHETRAPRTVIVETGGGDFIVLLSFTSLFRTIDLPRWLLDSNLDVYNALNLDGGRSAGYWAGEHDYVDSYVPLPAVIAVYEK